MLAEPRLKLHRLPLSWAGLRLAALLPCNKLTSALDALTLVSGDWGSASGLPAAPKKPQELGPHHGAGRPSRAQLREQSEDSKGSQAQTWQSPSQRSDCWSLCHVFYGGGGGEGSGGHQVCWRLSKSEGTRVEAGQLPRRPTACRTPRAQDFAPRVLSSMSLHVESKSVQNWGQCLPPLPHRPASPGEGATFYSRSHWLGLSCAQGQARVTLAPFISFQGPCKRRG